nr:uncharacterized protein LOC124214348 [Neodiprion pinetum]
MIIRKISVAGEKWLVIGIYVNGDLKEKIGELKEQAEEADERTKVLVGGDFNARTGQEGGGCWGEGEERKKKEYEGFIKEAAEARTESKVWEIVNRERKKWKRVNEEIGEHEWREYFMGLLGGVENKVIEGGGTANRKGNGEEELQREEIRKVIGKLRDGKAPGGDGIVSEVWRYGGEEMEQWVWKTCNRVWVGEGWREDWREGLIAPIVKKGERKRVEEYRGVTLMPTLYKVYAMALAERLEREVVEKEKIPHNQTGFRKGMGTIDNVYVLNYLINRQVGRDKGKMVAFFVDLKAAFDSVDRKVMWETMERRGVREGLRVRVEEIYKEIKSRVRSGRKVGAAFWTERGVKQGYPLSPHLFNLLLADLEEEMGRGRGVGGVELTGGRVWTLAYADDIVLLAERKEEMKVMIRKLERYMDRKRLTVNVGKSRIMRFRKGGGRKKKMDWRWRGKRIEEVKEFSYLRYIVKCNGGQEAHLKERVRKAGVVMRQVWGIGRRRFGRDREKRIWLFDRLVWTVIEYASAIWGCREWRAVEAIQDRFLRWTLGVHGRTPGYLVREELQREKLGIRAGRTAWNFERTMERGEGSDLARRCWEEIREKVEVRRQGSRWERERESFFAERGAESREVVVRRERGEVDFREIEEREREEQRKERWKKIGKSRYNRWYRLVKGEGIPAYLGKGLGESRWTRVARFRLGSEMKEARRGESWQEVVREMLGEEGAGEVWMRELERIRDVRENERVRDEWETEVESGKDE